MEEVKEIKRETDINDLNITTKYNVKYITDKIEGDDMYKEKKGFIFYGPSGTGKTYISQVICKKYDIIMLNISAGIMQGHPGEEIEKFGSIFKLAKKIADKTNKKCMILFDEIDGIMPIRTAESKSGGEARTKGLTYEFLRLSGKIKNDVLVVGTTNKEEDSIDPALMTRLKAMRIDELSIPQKDKKLENDVEKFKIIKMNVDINKESIQIKKIFAFMFKQIVDNCKKGGKINFEELAEILEEEEMYNYDVRVLLDNISNMSKLLTDRRSSLEKLKTLYANTKFKELTDNVRDNTYFNFIQYYYRKYNIDNRTIKNFLEEIKNNTGDIELEKKIIVGKFNYGRRKNRSKKKSLKRLKRRSLKRRG